MRLDVGEVVVITIKDQDTVLIAEDKGGNECG
jgi:hypothetical protein